MLYEVDQALVGLELEVDGPPDAVHSPALSVEDIFTKGTTHGLTLFSITERFRGLARPQYPVS